MLPRLPQRLFQRSIPLSKCLAVSRRTTATPNFAISMCIKEREMNFLSSNFTSSQGGRCSCKKNETVANRSAQINGFRYKSTKPKRSKENFDQSKSVSTETDQETFSVASTNIRSQLPKKRQTTGDLITQKTEEEDEKSRRRYEKEDPPEEERHQYHKQKPDRSINKALMRTDIFDNVKGRDKQSFTLAIEVFCERDVHLRGHVEFIYVALRQMKGFGVHKDLESYKKIIDVFPKGRMLQTNMFQVEFLHYPKHQQCAIDILEQMEENGVIPDSEIQEMLTNIFGRWSFPNRKASRMLYWMPKFKYLSPWRLPEPLPDNALELAQLAVKQITSVDLITKVTTYNCEDLEDAFDLTWIVSGQSQNQQEIIQKLPTDRPIYVEGAFRVWMRNVCMNYFILRADPRPSPEASKEDPDDVGNLHNFDDEEFVDKSVMPIASVHEQEDGVVLAVCCTGTSSRDSVISWIRFLEQTNPRLGKDLSVLFTLKSPIGPTDDIEILSYRDVEEIKKIGKQRDPFLATEDTLILDPGMPDLRQVGIWTDSETKFPNWPHHFHAEGSASVKNKADNEKIIQHLERQTTEHRKIGDTETKDPVESLPDSTKQLK